VVGVAVSWGLVAAGFAAGLLIAALTAPVGVSGAVFLLPVQLDLLRVPSPAVTPTNLLFNIVATPGALLRYRAQGLWGGPLVAQLVTATVPGVVIGALIRVYLVPGVQLFRLIGGAVLLPLGLWLWWRDPGRPDREAPALSGRTVTVLALLVGVIGGVWHRRRIDPRPDLGRRGFPGLPCRTGGPGLDVLDLTGRCGDLCRTCSDQH
jgi:uncharacterized membrane protein YfcA